MGVRLIKIIFKLIIILSASHVSAQNVADQSLENQKKVKDLQNILTAIKETDTSLNEYTKNLGKTNSKGLDSEIENEIKARNERLKKLKSNLDEIASGIDLESYNNINTEAQVEWGREIQELLSPLLNEVKRLTNRPRELDRLHRKISTFQENVNSCDHAIKNIELLLKVNTSEQLEKELKDLKSNWIERKNALHADISVSEQRLEQLREENASIYSSIKQIPNLFLRSRGRNLVLAIVCTFTFWWLVKRGYHRFRRSPLMNSKDFVDYRRLVNLLYLCFSGSGCLSVFLFVLFLLGDWVLLILSFMIILGVVWTSKHAFPHFWNQGTLLLNVGPVREGEVIVYNGVVWEVQSLNVYVILRNEALQPPTMRVPLNDLFQLRSRQLGIGEKWFPTNVGDWILLPENKLAIVTSQTIDHVTVQLKGESTITYSTPDYIALSPKVLSTGFRIATKFGVDNDHFEIITSKIPKAITTDLKCELDSRLGSSSYKLTVEFDAATPTELAIQINLDVIGSFASDYDALRRLVHRICIECCAKNKWAIPYSQMVVHLQKTENTH